MAPKKKCPYCKKTGHTITKCQDAKQFLAALGLDCAKYTAKQLLKELINNGVSMPDDGDSDFDFGDN